MMITMIVRAKTHLYIPRDRDPAAKSILADVLFSLTHAQNYLIHIITRCSMSTVSATAHYCPIVIIPRR